MLPTLVQRDLWTAHPSFPSSSRAPTRQVPSPLPRGGPLTAASRSSAFSLPAKSRRGVGRLRAGPGSGFSSRSSVHAAATCLASDGPPVDDRWRRRSGKAWRHRRRRSWSWASHRWPQAIASCGRGAAALRLRWKCHLGRGRRSVVALLTATGGKRRCGVPAAAHGDLATQVVIDAEPIGNPSDSGELEPAAERLAPLLGVNPHGQFSDRTASTHDAERDLIACPAGKMLDTRPKPQDGAIACTARKADCGACAWKGRCTRAGSALSAA